MATIIERVYGGEPDKRVSLSNSSICRPFMADNWNKIRVCARLAINGNATIPSPASPHYALGLCSGPTVFNGATTQFVGIIGNVGTGIGMNYNAGPPAFFVTRHYVGKKVGTSIVGTTGNYSDVNNSETNAAYMSVYENSGVPMRDLMFVQITRPGGATTPTSGQYSVSMFVRTSNVNFDDATSANFASQAIAAIPAHLVAGHTNNQNHGNDFLPGGAYLRGTGTIAVDEIGISPLNHVMVGWDQTVATMEISDIGIVKIL